MAIPLSARCTPALHHRNLPLVVTLFLLSMSADVTPVNLRSFAMMSALSPRNLDPVVHPSPPSGTTKKAASVRNLCMAVAVAMAIALAL